MFKNKLDALIKVGFAEGTSFIVLLFLAMPLKYMLGFPIAVKIVGMLHGALFMWFLFALYEASREYKFSIKLNIMAFIASIVPFGTFVLEKSLKKIQTN
ncbi:MAG: DUF3817 domain-containing protein [Campylobacterales bacterium]|nr:DUF3817 domain-containing protein [Campylobacterales bacterium]